MWINGSLYIGVKCPTPLTPCPTLNKHSYLDILPTRLDDEASPLSGLFVGHATTPPHHTTQHSIPVQLDYSSKAPLRSLTHRWRRI